LSDSSGDRRLWQCGNQIEALRQCGNEAFPNASIAPNVQWPNELAIAQLAIAN
jgi:hypothetical protein